MTNNRRLSFDAFRLSEIERNRFANHLFAWARDNAERLQSNYREWPSEYNPIGELRTIVAHFDDHRVALMDQLQDIAFDSIAMKLPPPLVFGTDGSARTPTAETSTAIPSGTVMFLRSRREVESMEDWLRSSSMLTNVGKADPNGQ